MPCLVTLVDIRTMRDEQLHNVRSVGALGKLEAIKERGIAILIGYIDPGTVRNEKASYVYTPIVTIRQQCRLPFIVYGIDVTAPLHQHFSNLESVRIIVYKIIYWISAVIVLCHRVSAMIEQHLNCLRRVAFDGFH